jgi:hypothetical protein
VDGSVDIPRAAATSLAAYVRQRFVDRPPAAVAEVAVCEGDQLLGLVSLEQLLAASDDTPMARLIEGKPAVVGRDAGPESVALEAAHRGARTVAIVDESGRLLGAVRPEELISTLEKEHAEDMARLGGFLAGTGAARTASEEAPHARRPRALRAGRPLDRWSRVASFVVKGLSLNAWSEVPLRVFRTTLRREGGCAGRRPRAR